jgi:hypothetical protein
MALARYGYVDARRGHYMMTLRYLVLGWFVFDTLAVYLFARQNVIARPLTYALLTWTVSGVMFQVCTILNGLDIHVVHPDTLHMWNIILRIHIATIVGVLAVFNWWKIRNGQ